MRRTIFQKCTCFTVKMLCPPPSVTSDLPHSLSLYARRLWNPNDCFSNHARFTVGITKTACFPDKEYGQRKAATRALKPSVWEVVPPTSAIRSIRVGVCLAHFVRRLFHLKPPCVSTSSVNVKLCQRFYQKRAKTAETPYSLS